MVGWCWVHSYVQLMCSGWENVLTQNRCASQEALKEHEGSESYGKFFKTVTEEELLAGSPVSVRGKACDAFGR